MTEMKKKICQLCISWNNFKTNLSWHSSWYKTKVHEIISSLITLKIQYQKKKLTPLFITYVKQTAAWEGGVFQCKLLLDREECSSAAALWGEMVCMVEYSRQLLSYYVLEEMRHSPLHLQLNYRTILLTFVLIHEMSICMRR